MLSKHIMCKPKYDNFEYLANFIFYATNKDEKLLLSWCDGCDSGNYFELAIQEILETQKMNTKSQKEKTYYLIISFNLADEPKLSIYRFKEIEKKFAHILGFSNHQRICGVHKNANNILMHIAYNMIRKEKYTRLEPFRDLTKRDRTCRKMERDFGFIVDAPRDMLR